MVHFFQSCLPICFTVFSGATFFFFGVAFAESSLLAWSNNMLLLLLLLRTHACHDFARLVAKLIVRSARAYLASHIYIYLTNSLPYLHGCILYNVIEYTS
jgi:hypothetical protein